MHLWTSTDADAFTGLVWLGVAVRDEGLATPSLRTIARGRCSPSSLLNWFGSKAEMHRRVVRTLGVKWGRVLAATLIPLTAEDRLYARLRLAYDELARSDTAVAAELDALVRLERELIVWWAESAHERTPDNRAITILHAVLLRLWDERLYPDAQGARALWEGAVALWLAASDHAERLVSDPGDSPAA